ncbi:hypothetical protein [Veillonella sp.]|uniref:hypothetical protein n=1 Tax=Veillonella sp. TaxID=1926307 RepID=UPI002903684F|nr:hypothetical protein [Veillonella sp.]MDU1129536.1 hypothetical protein [Veillonella sp.]MDU2868974.1 hypothetical protein [Veillonella sp.]
MFESHYLKPFMVSLGITIILISGMGLSLRGMAGTGPTHDAAEISFNLPDDGESDTGVETVDTAPKPVEDPMEKPQNVTPEGAAPKANSLVDERKPEEERTKELSESTAASSVRREWTVPKAIESETSSSEQAVVTHGADSKDGKSSKNSKAPIGKEITSDPNATGDGLPESSDLSVLSDLALSLLTPGQQALLQKPDINPHDYLRTVQEQGRASVVTGKVVVRVNFDVNGNVIVGEHTPLIVDDVPSAVRDEALRIIKSSGSIVNRRGEPVYLAVPVILGQ